MLIKKNLCQKKCWVQKYLGQTKFWAKKYFGPNNTLVKKIRVPKNLDQKSLVKIGSKTAEIFLYGHMDKCCLDKCHRDSWHLLKMVPKTYIEGLVKIG